MPDTGSQIAGDARAERVRELFDAALEVDAGARGAFLAGECGGDVELRRELEELLRCADDGDFLKPPEGRARLALEPDGPDPLIGQTIGAYTIQSVIARGGMGTVYLAEQDNPRRPVAVKIMQAGLWSGSAKRRFEYESHVLGRLQHPNIAQVYEAGTHRLEVRHGESLTGATTHFFAMEYVPGGLPITEYADRRKLGVRERLELFLQVCDGVHYGHQRGVIHRDLKPGNILVGGDETSKSQKVETSKHGGLRTDSKSAICNQKSANVKLIDFGVARCTDSDIAVTTMHTDVGQLIGTLAYMSPEQCEGDPLGIDTRSDVYSLGVVLYELLCGRLPYELTTRSIPRSTRTICETAPVRPSTINRKLRGDLEILALKALEKEREKRYASVEALAGDIRRYLRGEPIEARRATTWTVALRWVGRHPALSTSMLCVVIVFAVVIAASATFYFVSFEPDEIACYRDGQRIPGGAQPGAMDHARLNARNGKELHRWGGAQRSIGSAALAGRMAVIAYTALDPGPFAKQLCVYDVDGERSVPVWSRRIETKDVLPKLREKRDFTGEHFNVHFGMVADVFASDEYPSEEIIAVFSTYTSHRIVRIYDFDGRLLFEAWHDGALGVPYWMADAGILVFTGDDHQRYWDEFGKLKSAERAPLVVFAVRPVAPGIHRDDYFNSDDSLREGQVPQWLAWYKWLYQEGDRPAHVGEYELMITRPGLGQTGRCAQFCLETAAGQIGLSWEIDEFGNESRDTRIIGEEYKLARKSGKPPLPDPELFKLISKQPIPSPTTKTTTQPRAGGS